MGVMQNTGRQAGSQGSTSSTSSGSDPFGYEERKRRRAANQQAGTPSNGAMNGIANQAFTNTNTDTDVDTDTGDEGINYRDLLFQLLLQRLMQGGLGNQRSNSPRFMQGMGQNMPMIQGPGGFAGPFDAGYAGAAGGAGGPMGYGIGGLVNKTTPDDNPLNS